MMNRVTLAALFGGVFSWPLATLAQVAPGFAPAADETTVVPSFSSPSSVAGAAKVGVEIFVAGPAAVRIRLRDVVAAGRKVRWVSIDRIDSTQILAPDSGVTASSVRVWLDATHATRARIYFANRATQRFMVREVELHSGWGELGHETIAQIIEASLDALTSGDTIGLTRSEMANVLEVPRKSHPRAGVESLFIEPHFQIIYWVGARSSGPRLEHGPGIGASLEAIFSQSRLRAALWASGQWILPRHIEPRPIGATLTGYALRGGFAIGRALTTHSGVDVRLGAGFDRSRVAPLAQPGVDLVLDEASVTYDPRLHVALVWRVHTGQHVELWLGPMAELELRPRDLEVKADGQRQTILSPYWLQPGLLLGLQFP